MKKFGNLIVPEAVNQACDIFAISVEQLLQKFLDNVNLVKYFSEPIDPDRWANLFLLDCALDHINHETYIDSFKSFMDRIVEIPNTSSLTERERIIQTIIDDWQKVILENRIHDIMKKDEDAADDEFLIED